MKLRVKIQYIGFIVILLMFFCGITNNMSVVHAEVYKDFEYCLINNDTEVEITGYNGSDTEVVIPDVIDGKDVTSIGKGAFAGEKLTNVIFPQKLISIGDGAFRACTKLKSINIPKEVVYIGNEVFKATFLEEISMPLNATSLDDIYVFRQIFAGFSSDLPYTLKKVIITRATIVPNKCFYKCNHLKSIELPANVTKIGDAAFVGCFLTDFTIPDSVQSIGSSAFASCTYLSNINIPMGVKSIEEYTFDSCYYLTSLTIPSSVVKIAENAVDVHLENIICEENSYAHNFAIENKKSYKLYCSPENHVYSTEWLSDETHHWKECIREECTACTARKDVTEHTWKTVIDKAATGEEEGSQHEECTECGYKKEAVSIPKVEAHKHIGVLVEAVAPRCETDGTIAYYVCDCGKYYAEASCETELTQEQLVIKATGHKWKTVIDKAATGEEEGSQHEECTECGYKKEAVSIPKLEEVHKHMGVLVETVAPRCETDGSIAYYVCDCGKYYAEASCETELTQEQLVIKATGHKWKTVIDKAATVEEEGSQHEECTECGYKKKAVSIPKVIEHVPDNKQDNTIILVEKGKTFTDSNTNVIFKVTNPGTIVVGNVVGAQVEYMKPSDSAARVVIPETVTIDGITYRITSIAANAFKNDRKIAELLIGNNVITIGNNAFNGCKKLTKVTIGKGVITIGTSAFSGCSRLKTVSMGANVTTIGAKAFYKCTALTKITIPAKVRKIGKQAFYGCKKLKRIVIKTTKLTKPKVGSKAFKGIHPKATIKVPKKKLPSYKKILKARGVGSKAKIKK